MWGIKTLGLIVSNPFRRRQGKQLPFRERPSAFASTARESPPAQPTGGRDFRSASQPRSEPPLPVRWRVVEALVAFFARDAVELLRFAPAAAVFVPVFFAAALRAVEPDFAAGDLAAPVLAGDFAAVVFRVAVEVFEEEAFDFVPDEERDRLVEADFVVFFGEAAEVPADLRAAGAAAADPLRAVRVSAAFFADAERAAAGRAAAASPPFLPPFFAGSLF